MTSKKSAKRSEYVTRESVLELLSDNEVASVTTADTTARLSDGDEYLDLEHLNQGVQRASGTSASMGLVLPKKAVHENTWNKILAQLAVPVSAKTHVS
jgi:hypothetical protein